MTFEEKTLFQDLYNQYRYNNNSTVGRFTRRNEYVDEAFLLKQRVLIDLQDLCLVSKLHVKKMKGAKINMYVSEFPYEGYKQITFSEKVHWKQERVIDVGSLPARYLIVEVEKGVPLPGKDNVTVYGIKHKNIDHLLGSGSQNLLFDKTYQIIYGFQ